MAVDATDAGTSELGNIARAAAVTGTHDVARSATGTTTTAVVSIPVVAQLMR